MVLLAERRLWRQTKLCWAFFANYFENLNDLLFAILTQRRMFDRFNHSPFEVFPVFSLCSCTWTPKSDRQCHRRLLPSGPTCLSRSLSRLEALPCSSRDLEYFTACSRSLSFSLPSSRLADSQSWRSLRTFETENVHKKKKTVLWLNWEGWSLTVLVERL